MDKATEKKKQVQEIIDGMEPDMSNGLLHEFFGLYEMLKSGEFKTIDEVKNYIENIAEMYL